MMRTVWILNHYAQEPGGPGGTRHFSLAKNLARHGWRAVIVAASIEHGTGRDRLVSGEQTRFDVIDGVPFLWLKSSSYTGNGWSRVRNMLDYTRLVLSRRALQSLPPPDVVIGSSVHPFAAWAGARLARRYGVPFVFEVRDLWPQTLVDMGRLKQNSAVTRIMRWLETRLYREAKRVVVLLPKADDYIAGLGISRDKVVWIPNGVDLDGASEIASSGEAKSEFKIMYLGAHGQANALETVVDAMRLVEDMSLPVMVSLHLFGDGPKKADLMDRAKTLGCNNIVFHPAVPKNQVAALAATADAFVLSVRDLPNLYRFGISMNKLFDYMAAGRPILMASSAVNDPVAEAGAGLSVAPEDPAGLAEAIAAMAVLPNEERLRMGEAGRRYVEAHHSFDVLAGRLAGALDEACRA